MERVSIHQFFRNTEDVNQSMTNHDDCRMIIFK